MNDSLDIKKALLAILLSLNCSIGYAQFPSVLGRFEADNVRGCSGWQINITLNDPDGIFETPEFFYENLSSTSETDLNFTYNTPGQYYVYLLLSNSTGEFEGNRLDSLMVEVFEPQEPNFIIHNCADHRIKVEINEDYYDSYEVTFSSTETELLEPFSFSSEYVFGSLVEDYRIEVEGLFDNAVQNCAVANQGFTSIEEIEIPVITSLETRLNHPEIGDIQMAHSLGENSIYQLYSSENGTESYDSLRSVEGAETLLQNLNTENNYYCYQIQTYDACNDVTITTDNFCSIRLNVESSDDGNLISWETNETSASSYNIIRNNSLLEQIIDNNIKNFNDTAVICNAEYIYNVQAVQASGTGSSLGLDTLVVATQSGELPPVLEYPSSSINRNNEVILNWVAPNSGEIPFRQYIIEKNINDRSWRFEGVSPDTSYIDTNAEFFGTLSYRISYDDECGNTATPSSSTDPVILKQVSSRGNIVTYNWNKYETWIEGIRNYTIERLDTAGNVIEEFPVLSGREKDIEFEINDLEDKLIRVRAESLDESPLFSYSNTVITRLETQMFLPTAFTPDDDNLNDRFIAKGPAVFDFTMKIYNRWGILIFETSDLVGGWDGTINGKKALEGTYIYKIFFEDGVGKKFDQTGSFLLLRNG